MYSEVKTPINTDSGSEELPILQEPQVQLPRFRSHRRSESCSFEHQQPSTSRSMNKIDTSSVDAFLSDGLMASKLPTVLEKARGGKIPSMGVSFENLRITAEVSIADDEAQANDAAAYAKSQLPTLWNSFVSSLMVFNPKKKKTKHQIEILKGLNGNFKPGTTTLVLGQPSSGKSSLMKILSGRFPLDKNVTVSGDILYNGIEQAEIKKKLPRYVEYVTQRDYHHRSLTVLENFEFAHRCCNGSEFPKWASDALTEGTPAENQHALEAARALHEYYPQLMVKILGLDNCANTIVGDAMIRGVSGGERKRVTTGEMSFGMKYVSLMDEISTGLDSAATFDIVKSLKTFAHDFGKTVVISLLQPPPEVYNLFDNVLIMNSGDIIYNGPRESILQYFEQMGFKCPPRRDVADFLLDLGTDRQAQYCNVTPSNSIRATPVTGADFADRFRNSDIYATTLTELKTAHDPAFVEESRRNVARRNDFQLGFFEELCTVLKRSMTVTLRNTAFIKGRAFMVILMGIIYATTFFDSNPGNPQVIMGLIFAAVLFVSLGQSSQIPTFIAERDIFYKQRGANFFRTTSYVISASVTQVPFAIAEAVVFGSLVYWMAGLVSEAKAFIIFEILMVLVNLSLGAWFFFLSSISPNLNIAKPLSMVSILFFVVFSGFVVSKNNMPDYFIWVYWINPVAWCIRALAVNQYKSDEFIVCEYNGIDFCDDVKFPQYNYGSAGDFFLGSYHVPSERFWIGAGIAFTLGVYAFFMFLSYLVLEYKRYETTANTSVTLEEEEKEINNCVTSPHPRETSMVECEQNFALAVQNERKFTPVALTFKDLWYSVPVPGGDKNEEIDLLKGVSGFALPGTITALMGSSGAGKTTLMDVIAGRKTGGKIRGQILLNGYEANELAIRRCTGYCEQMDIHSDSATIEEAITFSAFLRQSSDISDADKIESVNECLDILELRPMAGQIIRGSSVELMKRLTIGVELAAQPSVLFLDEPTSGLDARSAKIIMQGVRKIADTGRTIVCTIHQPSSEVFSVFDSLLLLKRGGQTVFFGEIGQESSNLINYFEKIPGTPKIEPGYNPATWMLEVIGAGVGNEGNNRDYATYFEESDQRALLEEDLNQPGVAYPSDSMSEMIFDTKRASLGSVQLKFLISRFFRMYWRTPTYNFTRFVLYIILAILFGAIYIDSDFTTFSGINSGIGMVFLVVVFMGIIAFNSVLPMASYERTSFYRERACQTYNALWYFIGGTVVEIPYVVLSTLVFTAIFYPFVGFVGYYEFFQFWLIFMAYVLLQVYFGQFMAYALPSVEVAAILGVLLNSIFILFMGFNPPADQIPGAYKWLYTITPGTYALSALGAIVFGGKTDIGKMKLHDAPSPFTHLSIAEYIDNNFKMTDDDIWRNFGILLVCVVFFRILALLSLRFVNHQKR